MIPPAADSQSLRLAARLSLTFSVAVLVSNAFGCELVAPLPPLPFDPAWASWPMPNPPATGLPHPQSYDLTKADVVVDRVTGLQWQRAVPASEYTWEQAGQYCANLELAGSDDWRLPSRVQLVSLVDFTRSFPAIDSTAFSGTPVATFWTSTLVTGAAGMATNVNFELGSVYFSGVDMSWRVRCVH